MRGDHGAHPGVEVNFGSQGLCREFILWNVGQEASGIDKHTVSANGSNQRNIKLFHAMPQVFHLPDTSVNVVVVQAFLDPDGHCLHVASGHAAVGMQAFIHHYEVAGFFVHFPFIGR